jgi:hypothetical protein
MKTSKQLDEEIDRVCDYVNSFPRYDAQNSEQKRGFELLEVLEWVRGRHHKKRPSDMLEGEK